MAMTLHQDPEIAMSSLVGFMIAGKAMEWFSGHSDFFAACSYVLAGIAAVVTIYYKIKNKGK
jgi:hypothetical protein